MAPLADVVVLALIYGAYYGLKAAFRHYKGDNGDTKTKLYCPRRDGDVPISSDTAVPLPVWEEPSTNCYGYKCEACGNVHTWIYGPPAPIYVGDKFQFTFTGPRVDAPRRDAD